MRNLEHLTHINGNLNIRRTSIEDLSGLENLTQVARVVWIQGNPALKNLEGTDAHSGIQLIFSKLDNTLKNKGLQPMDNTTGAPFDVDTMEAVTRIPAPSEDLKGKVVDEIERGYKLGNKILRYAKVVVGE